MHFVIVDIETTGGNPQNSKITEIAMYKCDGEQIIDEFVTLINPETSIPPFIVNLTGITDRMVASAPVFEEVAQTIEEFSEGCIFVAHNVGFDYGMIRAEYNLVPFVCFDCAKNTPGERCSWDTITRSAPLITNDPRSVI